MDEHHRHKGPPPEAYGRVTNPGRYRSVQAAAVDLLDKLEQVYSVHRSETAPAPELVTRYRASKAVRLDPEGDDAGTLVCTFTPFPGVRLSLGGGYEQAFPSCGCDACDESPESVVEDLIRTAQLFAQGGLVEGVRDNRYSYRIGGRSGATVISDDDPRARLPARLAWRAWPRR